MKYKCVAVLVIIIFLLGIRVNAHEINSVDIGKNHIISAIDAELGSDFDASQILDMLSDRDFKSAFNAILSYGEQKL